MKINILRVLTIIFATIAFAGVAATNNPDQVSAGGSNSPEKASEPSWGSHEPFKDCVACHGEQVGDSPGEPIAPAPQLCYRCHKKYAELEGWKHGPVAAGQCLICHKQHRSENQALLAKPIPELCHHCHQTKTLELVPNHTDQSYQNCSDCHHAHTSPGRMLLKGDFLKTDAGLNYIAQNPAANPRPIFVDRKASLAGLEGVKVTTEVDNPDLFEEYGITEELLAKEVELQLRDKGVAVLPHKEQTEQQSTLHVRLRLMELPSQRRRGRIDAVSGSLNVSLRQKVELLPRQNNPQQRFCAATTWDTDAIVIWGRAQTEDGLKQAVEALIARFSKDYFEANPKTASPASTQ